VVALPGRAHVTGACLLAGFAVVGAAADTGRVVGLLFALGQVDALGEVGVGQSEGASPHANSASCASAATRVS
jgi:hypothetical protein